MHEPYYLPARLSTSRSSMSGSTHVGRMKLPLYEQQKSELTNLPQMENNHRGYFSQTEVETFVSFFRILSGIASRFRLEKLHNKSLFHPV